MTSKLSVLGSAALALFALAGTARADVTIYTSLSDFLAAVSTTGTDTFTGFSISGTTASPVNRTAGSFSYTATVLPTATGATGTHTFFGGGTTANPFIATNIAGDTMSFSNFSAGVTAAGGNFFASNASGLFTALGGVIVTATDASGVVKQTIVPTNASAGSFLGFVSTTGVTSFTVASNIAGAGSSIWPSMDNLVLATSPVPEPSTYAMLMVGLGLAGVVIRRRRN